MRFYKVSLHLWDVNKKIGNIKEFRQLTGADLTEAKQAIENYKDTEFHSYVEVIVSAERLGNYIAWRDLTDDTLHLGFEVLEEYIPQQMPAIYE